MEISVTVKFEPFRDIDDVLAGFAFKTVESIKLEISNLMKEEKSGVKYKRLPHRSSASGESPRTQSGKMIGSFNPIEFSSLSAQLKSDLDYAAILEDKRNRPFSEKAIEKALPQILEDAATRLERI